MVVVPAADRQSQGQAGAGMPDLAPPPPMVIAPPRHTGDPRLTLLQQQQEEDDGERMNEKWRAGRLLVFISVE